MTLLDWRQLCRNHREKKDALGRTDTMNNKMKLAKKHPNVR